MPGYAKSPPPPPVLLTGQPADSIGTLPAESTSFVAVLPHQEPVVATSTSGEDNASFSRQTTLQTPPLQSPSPGLIVGGGAFLEPTPEQLPAPASADGGAAAPTPPPTSALIPMSNCTFDGTPTSGGSARKGVHFSSYSPSDDKPYIPIAKTLAGRNRFVFAGMSPLAVRPTSPGFDRSADSSTVLPVACALGPGMSCSFDVPAGI
jgi:hypothetical protein